MDFIGSIIVCECAAIASDPSANIGSLGGRVAEYSRESTSLVYNYDTVVSMEVVVTSL